MALFRGHNMMHNELFIQFMMPKQNEENEDAISFV